MKPVAGQDDRGGRRVRWGAPALVVLALVALLALLPTSTTADTTTILPGFMGPGPTKTCFWGEPASNVGPIDQLDYPVAGTNIGELDTNVVYYYTILELPPGASIELHGQYPHSRFFSLTTYVSKEGLQGYPATSIHDDEIDPNPGSMNPFRSGAVRDSPRRSYTLTISGEPEPAKPAPNTLYAGQEGKTGETQQVVMIMRIYRPDRDLEANGGVPLPLPVLLQPGASQIDEEARVCAALEDHTGVKAVPSTGVPVEAYVHLRELAPAPHPAQNPIVWERFFNPLRLVVPFYRGAGEPYEKLIPTLPATLTSGLYSTPSNAYVIGFADRTIGPNREGHNILVLHARMPTHPETYEHNLFNDYAGTQVRYWSLCTTGSVAKPPTLPTDSACLFDQEVPVNRFGEYTVVVSLPEDRPANARPLCGAAWLNWGTVGDDLEGEWESHRRTTLDLLVMRNQLSSPSFTHSIADVATPGTEEQVMGPYYPRGTYMTRQQFEARGCFAANP